MDKHKYLKIPVLFLWLVVCVVGIVYLLAFASILEPPT